MKQAERKPSERNFAEILVLAAVAGAIAQIVGVVVEIGRAAAWWQ
jgi:hypothetical protein